ncbi:MAG TPA: response regulator transcription factor [Thermopetrobacter sp.]|nr:response regulator transcription factor [Thermopetrobacter sp.]
MRVLIVEDNAAIARDIGQHLEQAGYVVDYAFDGEEADFKGFTEDYDAVILDLGLPKLDGLAVLRNWRMEGRTFPVLVLTARGSWQERVAGIDAGGDDYVAKPFEMEEVLARLRAIIRRSRGLAAPVIRVGPLELDTRTARAILDGRALDLTPLEYRLVSYLAHHQGRAVPRMELMEHIYEGDVDRNPNTLDVLVGRLRRKIGAGFIRTRRGHGYMLVNPETDEQCA